MSWADEIAKFIVTKAKELEPLFDASGCREQWVQAELFRHMHPTHPSFWVNLVPIGPMAKADISNDLVAEEGKVRAIGPRPMIGEVKVIAADHQYKCITGAGIRAFRSLPKASRGQLSSQELDGYSKENWGLIPDFLRLRDAAMPRRTERILVLVAKMKTAADLIGGELEEIGFLGAKLVHLRLSTWGWVRIWTLA